MKKFILPSVLTFLLLNTCDLYSQDDRLTYYNGIRIFDYQNLAFKGDSITKANRIASMQKTQTEKKKGKDKVKWTTLYEYDSLGRTVLFKSLDRKNKLSGYSHYEFDKEKHLIVEMYKKWKSFDKTMYEYSGYKQASKITTYKGSTLENMVLSNYVVNTFNNDSNKISSITYNPNGDIKAIVLYEYDQSKKIGTAKMYGKKGKLQHSWSFDCNKQGEIDKKGKEEKICKSKAQLANGHTQEITIDESNNNIKRQITELDEKGKFVMSEEYTGKDGTVLSHRSEIKTHGDTSFYSYAYYRTNVRKPYLYIKHESVWLNHKTIAEHDAWYGRGNKPYSSVTSSFVYNSLGLVENEIVIDEIEKTTSVNSYSYTRY